MARRRRQNTNTTARGGSCRKQTQEKLAETEAQDHVTVMTGVKRRSNRDEHSKDNCESEKIITIPHRTTTGYGTESILRRSQRCSANKSKSLLDNNTASSPDTQSSRSSYERMKNYTKEKSSLSSRKSQRLAGLDSLIDKELGYANVSHLRQTYSSSLGDSAVVKLSSSSSEDLASTVPVSKEIIAPITNKPQPVLKPKAKKTTNPHKKNTSVSESCLASWLKSSQNAVRPNLTSTKHARVSAKNKHEDSPVFTSKPKNLDMQTPAEIRCRSMLKSTANVSTPCSETQSEHTEDEDLFGFENLLRFDEPKLDLSGRLSPISERETGPRRSDRKNKHAKVLSAFERQELEPWKGLLDYSASKMYEKKPVKRTKTHKKSKTEKENCTDACNLFELRPFEDQEDRFVEKEDIDLEYESEDDKKPKKKKQTNKKLTKPVCRDEPLPWDEIMAHELVIETV